MHQGIKAINNGSSHLASTRSPTRLVWALDFLEVTPARQAALREKVDGNDLAFDIIFEAKVGLCGELG